MLVEAFVLPKADLGSFVEKLKAGYEVIGPVAKDTEFVFAPIGSAADLSLDYDTTILPPHKKYLAPPKETLMTFSGPATKTGEPAAPGKQLLFGVHACDVNGMLSLDKVFLGTYPDPYYKAHRENTVIVGLNCTEPCDNGFCSSFNTGPGMDTGFDLSLTDIGDKYVVCVGSEAGKALAAGLARRQMPTGLPRARPCGLPRRRSCGTSIPITLASSCTRMSITRCGQTSRRGAWPAGPAPTSVRPASALPSRTRSILPWLPASARGTGIPASTWSSPGWPWTTSSVLTGRRASSSACITS